MASVGTLRSPASAEREFTETIDAQRGRIRGQGPLTRQAADMITRIAKALYRDGHTSLVFDLTAVNVTDAAGLAELDALQERFEGGRRTPDRTERADASRVTHDGAVTDARRPTTWTSPT